MVLRAQWPLGTIAQFFHFVAEEKKKDKKTKAFFDWATKGITVKSPKHKRVSIPIKQHINKTRALTSKFKLSFSTDSVFFPVPLFFCHPWTLLFATKTLLPKRKSVCLPFYRYSNDLRVSFEDPLLAATADNKAKFNSWPDVIRSNQCRHRPHAASVYLTTSALLDLKVPNTIAERRRMRNDRKKRKRLQRKKFKRTKQGKQFTNAYISKPCRMIDSFTLQGNITWSGSK